MYEGLTNVFWGIFIDTFSIKLGPIMILPTFVGFMIISSGINTIYNEHKTDEFKKALDFSRIVTVMALVGWVIGFFTGGNYQYFILLQIWPIIVMTVELIMFYYLFLGIIKHFDSIGNLEVSERLIGSSRLYMIIFIITLSVLSFVILFNLGGLNALLAIVLLILRISIMLMISGIKKDIIPDNIDDNQGI